MGEITYTDHVRDNVGSQASNPEAARLKVYCLTLCDLLDRLTVEVDRLRALVRQIAAWDNHTHHTEEGRNCCPTCLARNGVITEWQAWSESDTVAEYEADDCG